MNGLTCQKFFIPEPVRLQRPGASLTAFASHRARMLAGTARVPGDKSISHRALILGALSVGETVVTGLSRGDDVARTESALRHVGAEIRAPESDTRVVFGRGVGGLCEPASVLDLGNSGTGARLLMGAVASHHLTAHFAGDASLSTRPMDRVILPLRRMGADISARDGTLLPLTVAGARSPVPIEYVLPVPSAQVKSAILLAALNTPGRTSVIEPVPSRDHTERMLAHFGAAVTEGEGDDGRRCIAVEGEAELTGRAVAVPGDPSSAAFLVAAALAVPGSRVTIGNVGINPLRTGFFDTVREMGADIELSDVRDIGGEPVADVTIRHGGLVGLEVPPERAPAMIDEYPVLAALAAGAEGRTVMRGVRELRVKESDRISAMTTGLRACGVTVDEFEDGLAVIGLGGPVPGGAVVDARLDHRVAMSFLVLGMASREPVVVDHAETIATSFPEFIDLMTDLGAEVSPAPRPRNAPK